MTWFDDKKDNAGIERVEFTRVPTASRRVQPFDFASEIRARSEASLGFDLSEVSSLEESSVTHDVETMIEEARREAREQALEEARAEHEQALEALRLDHAAQADAFLSQLDATYRRAAQMGREAALQLSGIIAEAILEETLEARPEVYVQLAATALRRAIGLESIKVRVHSDAAATLEEAASRLSADVGTQVEIVADPALQVGDVRVESDAGLIDGTLRERLERLVEASRYATVADGVAAASPEE